jgi:hypothetical protein
MAPSTVPVGEPSAIQAGDTVIFDTHAFTDPSYGAFSSDAGWILTYDWASPTFRLTSAAASQGSGWRTTVTGTETDKLKSGTKAETLTWAGSFTLSSQKFTLRRGTATLTPNLTTADSFVAHAQQALSLIESAILGRIPSGMESYQIQGRALVKIPLRDLMDLRNYYRAELRSARWGGNGTLQVVFNPPAPIAVPFGQWQP